MPPVYERFFMQLAGVCASARRGFGRHSGVSEGRRRLLALLDDHGELSQARLRESLGVDPAAVTRLIKALEAEGLVQRRLDPDDNRYTLARLTSAGGKRVADLRRSHRAFQKKMLSGISSSDRELAAGVLARIEANLVAEAGR